MHVITFAGLDLLLEVQHILGTFRTATPLEQQVNNV
jgi:hypothetical protein